MESIRVTAKTVADAITEASIQLGTSSDNIEYTVIEKGSAGLFGLIGGKKAVIEAKKKFTDEDLMKEVFGDKNEKPAKEFKRENKKEFRKEQAEKKPEAKKEAVKETVKETAKVVKEAAKETVKETAKETVKETETSEPKKEFKKENKRENKKEYKRENK